MFLYGLLARRVRKVNGEWAAKGPYPVADTSPARQFYLWRSMDEIKKDSSDTVERGYFSRSLHTHRHEFYLSGEILEPEAYIEWFDIIRNASQNDEVILRINSFGGNLSSALQFMRCMQESEAFITCSVEGECMSAATIIFLSGHQLEISPHSLFMFHNYRGGISGKGGEIYDNAVFERDWSIKLMREVYRHFLTNEEIEQMMHGRDLWMDTEEVLVRAEIAMEARTKEIPEEAV